MNALPDTPQPTRPEPDEYETRIQTQPDVGDALTPAELTSLQNASNGAIWNSAVASIRGKREGKLPSDWRERVAATGLDSRSCLKW